VADERLFGLRRAPADVNVTLFPSSPTSNAPSDWQQVDAIPLGHLPAGASKRLALVVTGFVCQVRTVGATPERGVLEVCMGLTGGARSTFHRARFSLRHESLKTTLWAGMPFTFIMVQQSAGTGRPAISDPTFGATTNTSAAEFGLYARLNWNGDTPAYAASATEPPLVRDVRWFWADMDELEALDLVLAERDESGALDWTSSNAIGASSQSWCLLHATYMQPSPTVPPPDLQHGAARSGAWVVESSARTNRPHPTGVPTPTEVPVVTTIGSMQRLETEVVEAFGRMRLTDQIASVVPVVQAHTMLAIRVDLGLTPQAGSYVASHGEATELYDGQPWTPYSRHEVSAPAAPVGVLQLACATFQVLEPGGNGFRAHTALEDQGATYPSAFAYVEGAASFGYQERIPVLDLQARTLPFEAVDEARLHFVRFWFQNSGPFAPASVTEISHAVFNRVHDQSLSAPKWVIPTPIELSLHGEGPLVGALPSPPYPPIAATPVRVSGHEIGRIRARAGYSRTWPNWIKPRRVLALTWGPLAASHGAAVSVFLRENRNFALPTPGGGESVAVTQRTPFSESRLPDGRVELTTEVTELVFTA
jgi:hypothetical protein